MRAVIASPSERRRGSVPTPLNPSVFLAQSGSGSRIGALKTFSKRERPHTLRPGRTGARPRSIKFDVDIRLSVDAPNHSG